MAEDVVATIEMGPGWAFATGNALAPETHRFSAVSADGETATIAPTGRTVDSPGEVSAADVARYLSTQYGDATAFRRRASTSVELELHVRDDQIEEVRDRLASADMRDRWGQTVSGKPEIVDVTPASEYERPSEALVIGRDDELLAEQVLSAASESLADRARSVTEEARASVDVVDEPPVAESMSTRGMHL